MKLVMVGIKKSIFLADYRSKHFLMNQNNWINEEILILFLAYIFSIQMYIHTSIILQKFPQAVEIVFSQPNVVHVVKIWISVSLTRFCCYRFCFQIFDTVRVTTKNLRSVWHFFNFENEEKLQTRSKTILSILGAIKMFYKILFWLSFLQLFFYAKGRYLQIFFF